MNEEPKSATEPADVLDAEQMIDLDDVEGHGMREVAAGLGAAAVLAGGATAAAAAAGVHISPPSLHPSTPSISHPIDTADRATDWAVDTSRDVRDGAIDTAASAAQGATSLANREVSATSTTAGNAVGAVDRVAGSSVDAAGNLARTEVRVAGQAVSATEQATLDATGATTHAATTTANHTAATAATTTSTTASNAARKAATVIQVTTSTVNALETTIVATVSDLNPQAGAGTSASSGWVTFSLGGENIASVQLHNGQASVTVKTTQLAGKVLQAVYSGDTLHASSLRSITL
jgi:hypothetical protein